MKGSLVVALFLGACAAQTPPPTPTILSLPVFVPLPTQSPSSTPSPTSTPLPTLTAAPTALVTLAPYEQYSIAYLRSRSYGGGTLEMAQKLQDYDTFTSYWVRYQSDGLFIYAVMNVPNADGLYPVIISVHGYFQPQEYNVLATDFTIENALADAGYITIHPTLRNYPPSDSGDNLFRVGDTIDVLNLIAVVKSQSGNGILQKADASRIGLGGHSMGGGVVLRVLTIDRDVLEAYLYAPTSGDEARNVDFFHNYTRDPQFRGERNAPPQALAAMSPQNFFSDIHAAILLAHGNNDPIIPDTWSEDTCNLLKAAGVDKRCLFYREAGHDFHGFDLADFTTEVVNFMKAHLG